MGDNKYQTKIYRKQGGAEEVTKAGGRNTFDSLAEFQFVNELFYAENMLALARNTAAQLTVTNLSTASTVLSDIGGSSPPVIPSTYAGMLMSCNGTMTNGSARLFSATAGRYFTIRFTIPAGGSTASVIFFCSGNASGISGVRVIGSTGSDCSSISIRQSAASFAKLILFGEANGAWSILSASSQVTERMA